ncbi:MAG TPA: hypothetical protein VK645_00395, partial [Chitinophagaceae bacterium]|nr:hypothetical protein [Chitinophagaceae bacterium]
GNTINTVAAEQRFENSTEENGINVYTTMGCIFINKWQENVNGFNAGLMILQQFFEIPETATG